MKKLTKLFLILFSMVLSISTINVSASTIENNNDLINDEILLDEDIPLSINVDKDFELFKQD